MRSLSHRKTEFRVDRWEIQEVPFSFLTLGRSRKGGKKDLKEEILYITVHFTIIGQYMYPDQKEYSSTYSFAILKYRIFSNYHNCPIFTEEHNGLLFKHVFTMWKHRWQILMNTVLSWILLKVRKMKKLQTQESCFQRNKGILYGNCLWIIKIYQHGKQGRMSFNNHK